MNEYIITFGSNSWGVLSGSQLQRTSTYAMASVFKSRVRAEKFAKKSGGELEVFYGFNARSNKACVTPRQSHINRSTPYRSV